MGDRISDMSSSTSSADTNAAAATARFISAAPLKDPEQFTAARTAYSYDPYNQFCSILVHKPRSILPPGTLHTPLEGHVSFTPYPTTNFQAPVPTTPKKDLVRIFIGQLPYQVTNMQLDWLCYTFGYGGSVIYPERIMKRDNHHGGKVPTGCIHAYCDPDLMPGLASGMHKRLLVDDTGVWCAQTPAEAEILNTYCLQLKLNKKKRIHNRPYDTVVVQHATSTYGAVLGSTPAVRPVVHESQRSRYEV